MRNIRIAVVIFNSPLGRIYDNLNRTIGWVNVAKQEGAEIVIFPEMNITGYGIDPKIRDTAQIIPGEVTDILQKLADREHISILAGMAEKDKRNKIYASHLLIQPNTPIGIYRKLHIAPPEKNIFSAGNHIPVFETWGIKFGIQLCYDAHFPELSTAMAVKDAEIIFIPHASPHGTSESKSNSWMRHLPARAYDNSVFVIACNACGDNGNGLTFPGIAIAYDPSGNVLYKCFSDKDHIMIADLKASDMEKVRGHRMRFFLPHRRTELYARKINTDNWKSLLQASISSAEALNQYLTTDNDDVRQVIARYPMRINPYYLSLIREKGDPIWKQAVPDIAEIEDDDGLDDPLHEEMQSPVPNLIHRYPDRVVMLVSGQCAMFCRYCMRKRRVGQPATISSETICLGIEYIRNNSQIRDVILSGGDPLLLEDDQIGDILTRIKRISHVEIIRIHSRIPCTLPQRITPQLCEILKKFHPLYINTHFNHPDEITAESSNACAMLADAGIPLGCQTVLLKGVNDDAEVMKRLMQKLMMIRIKPYYIHQADLVRGTRHFHTHPGIGLEIIRKLRGYTSGMGVPQLMIDLPGGGGKIPLVPEYVIEKQTDKWLIRNYENRIFEYNLCQAFSEKSE